MAIRLPACARPLLSLKAINLPDGAILILSRDPVPKMHVQLAPMDPAMAAFLLPMDFPVMALAAG